jgi:hypothetical protein
MLRKLMDIKIVKTPINAVGFYIIHFLIVFLLALVFTRIANIILPPPSPLHWITNWFLLVMTPYVLILGILIGIKKRLSKPYYAITIIISLILASMGGVLSLLGLIPIAYITTRKNSSR